MRLWVGTLLAAGVALLATAVGAQAGAYRDEADLVAAVRPVFVDIYNRGVVVDPDKPEGMPGHALRVKDEVGSGFIVDPSGLIVTNRHVVDGAYALSVTLADGSHVPATLVGKALTLDIALIKVDVGRPLPVAKLGDSDKLRLGERVVAIGNPLGFAGSVSSGIISAFHRNIGLSAYDDLIQTDAAINQGNSGGPLFNMDGEVIGVNQAIYTRNMGGSIGIGFSIPINDAKYLVESTLKHGTPHIGWLGMQSQTVTPEMAKALKLPYSGGVIVANLSPNGPAARAGVQVGDVVLQIAENKVESTSALNRVVFRSAGATMTLAVWRDGATLSLPVAILEWPKEAWTKKFEAPPQLMSYADFGLELVDTPGGPMAKSVVEKSVAWTAGVRVGDVIKRVKSTKVATIDQLGSVIDDMFNKQGVSSALLLLDGPSGVRWVDVSVAE